MIDSYTSLIDAINDWLDREDLTGSAPTMIALCEARLRRELQGLDLEASAPVVVTDGVGTLPDGCDFIRVLSYDGLPVDEVSPEIGREYAAGSTPQGYSLETNSIRVWPAWSGTVDVVYQGKLPALSDTNTSNTILAEHSDVYFYGSLMFAEGYLANDSRAVVFKQLWDEAIASLQRFYRRQRRDRPRLRNPLVVA